MNYLIPLLLLTSCFNSHEKEFFKNNPNLIKTRDKCKKDNPNACLILGEEALTKDEKKVAKKYYALACDAYIGQACMRLVELNDSEIMKKDYAAWACTYGERKGCDWLAEYHKSKGNMGLYERFKNEGPNYFRR
ncbi:MAG: hypothetical protein CME70_02545 [Halobacteriovorax sp.]|nr:hypothetical protein [Halobacteriovorax sp.]|tara:strand:+ start:11235 stop:11636 length:402 start_codon:yes stop_codon:yes gene_type:complete